MTVHVHGVPWRADAPELLFQQPNLRDFDVSPDGKRLLGVLPVRGRSPSIGISIVQNWAAGAIH